MLSERCLFTLSKKVICIESGFFGGAVENKDPTLIMNNHEVSRFLLPF